MQQHDFTGQRLSQDCASALDATENLQHEAFSDFESIAVKWVRGKTARKNQSTGEKNLGNG